MIKRIPLSKVAKLANISETELLNALIEAQLLYRDEQQQLQPTPLGCELELETIHTPLRDITLLPEDFSTLITYLEHSPKPSL